MKKSMWWLVVSLMVAVGLVACGGGGGDSSSSPTQQWNGPVDGSGYPVVAGTYAFTTGTVTMKCSDNSTGTGPALSMNVIVSQSQNAITLTQANPIVPAGLTITSQTPMAGTVDTSGNFVMNESLVATLNGVPGDINVSYNVTGTFSPTNWTGVYIYTAYFTAYNGSCTYATTFSGNKL